MIKIFEDKHICTKCNNIFLWRGYYSNNISGIEVTNIVPLNLRKIEYINGTYIVILNCPNCGSRDEIVINN